jgi:predicted  nucleic acid-binding Zn-ribbon protein
MPQLRRIRYFDGEIMLHETNWDFLTRQEEALEEEVERQEKNFFRCEETILKLKKKLEKVDKQMKILDTGYVTFGDLRDLHDLDNTIQIERSRDQPLEDWEDEDDVGSEHSEGTEPEDLDGEVQILDDDIRAMEALLFPTFASIIYDNKLKIYTVTLACKYGMPLRFNLEKKVEDDELVESS